MTTAALNAGTARLGTREVGRLGYGAMQLAGPGVFGPPKDRDAAKAVLRAAVEHGVNHIDTSDFYGPHITNQLIREALSPYPDYLVIVTKIGARRGPGGAWLKACTPADLVQAVHDNLRNLRLDALEVVNFRSMLDVHGPAEGSLEEAVTTLAELKHQGLVRHVGLSNVTPQVALAWLLQRSPNILLIPGTSSAAHLRENLAAGALELPDDELDALDAMGRQD